jgi:hypothetical protein
MFICVEVLFDFASNFIIIEVDVKTTGYPAFLFIRIVESLRFLLSQLTSQTVEITIDNDSPSVRASLLR